MVQESQALQRDLRQWLTHDFIPMEENWDEGWIEEKEEIRCFALSVADANKYDKDMVTLDMKTLGLIEALEHRARIRRSIAFLQAKIAKLEALYLSKG